MDQLVDPVVQKGWGVRGEDVTAVAAGPWADAAAPEHLDARDDDHAVPLEDGPVVERISMRDQNGFVAFYETSYSRIVGQILVVVGSLAEAEDITQEAFVRAAARWDRIGEYDAPEAWVRRVAMNLAFNTVQRTRRRAMILLRGHRETTAPEPSVERVALTQAMASLPLRYRAVIALHYMADLSVQQVAEELELPPATVRTRLARGRRRLAELLDDSLEPLPGEVTGG